MLEVWKPVFGFEHLYEVSNYGNVYSIRKRKKMRTGNKKYKSVGLYKNRSCSYFWVHRLVAEHFIENPKKYSQVNHKDGNPSNNNVLNLEWCTPSQNTKHAYKSGLFPKYMNLGTKNGRSKLTTEEVLTIRESLKHCDYFGIYKDLTEVFNVSMATILRIHKKTHWNIEK